LQSSKAPILQHIDKLKKKRLTHTKTIYKKSFINNSSILQRSKFGAGRNVCSPKSITAYSFSHYVQLFKKEESLSQNINNYKIIKKKKK